MAMESLTKGREVKPLLLKLSIFFAFSFTGFILSQFRSWRIHPALREESHNKNDEDMEKINKETHASPTATNPSVSSSVNSNTTEPSIPKRCPSEALRWVNACLRYELRNFNPSSGKTAKDLDNNLSQESKDKAKNLILEYASAISEIDQDDPCLSDDGWATSKPTTPSSATPVVPWRRFCLLEDLIKSRLLQGLIQHHQKKWMSLILTKPSYIWEWRIALTF